MSKLHTSSFFLTAQSIRDSFRNRVKYNKKVNKESGRNYNENSLLWSENHAVWWNYSCERRQMLLANFYGILGNYY